VAPMGRGDSNVSTQGERVIAELAVAGVRAPVPGGA
jgi:hypothetical protein